MSSWPACSFLDPLLGSSFIISSTFQEFRSEQKHQPNRIISETLGVRSFSLQRPSVPWKVAHIVLEIWIPYRNYFNWGSSSVVFSPWSIIMSPSSLSNRPVPSTCFGHSQHSLLAVFDFPSKPALILHFDLPDTVPAGADNTFRFARSTCHDRWTESTRVWHIIFLWSKETTQVSGVFNEKCLLAGSTLHKNENKKYDG